MYTRAEAQIEWEPTLRVREIQSREDRYKQECEFVLMVEGKHGSFNVDPSFGVLGVSNSGAIAWRACTHARKTNQKSQIYAAELQVHDDATQASSRVFRRGPSNIPRTGVGGGGGP